MSMEAGPSYSKPRLCHIFSQANLSSLAVSYSRREPKSGIFWNASESEFTLSCEFHRGGLLYSGILRQLVRKTPAYLRNPRQKKFTPEKVTLRFSPPAFARGWPLQSVSTAVTFTTAFRYFPLAPRPMNRPSLARILTTDLHCLKSVPPIPTVLSYRGSLSRALTTRDFFLLSVRVRGRKRAISTFPTIKELSQSASCTSMAISSISTVVIN